MSKQRLHGDFNIPSECPKCKTDISRSNGKWVNGWYSLEKFDTDMDGQRLTCPNCKTRFWQFEYKWEED